MKRKTHSRRKRTTTKSVFRLPDLEHAKAAVLNSLTSPDAQRGYPGTTKLHRLEENLGAANVDPTPEDLRAIKSASSNIRIEGARYPEWLQPLSGR